VRKAEKKDGFIALTLRDGAEIFVLLGMTGRGTETFEIEVRRGMATMIDGASG
jgi:hypothetical protein